MIVIVSVHNQFLSLWPLCFIKNIWLYFSHQSTNQGEKVCWSWTIFILNSKNVELFLHLTWIFSFVFRKTLFSRRRIENIETGVWILAGQLPHTTSSLPGGLLQRWANKEKTWKILKHFCRNFVYFSYHYFLISHHSTSVKMVKILLRVSPFFMQFHSKFSFSVISPSERWWIIVAV